MGHWRGNLIDSRYTESEKDLIFAWADRWCLFTDLVFKLFEPNGRYMPTEIDETDFQSIRFWLADNKQRFLALWKDFYESQDWSLDTGMDIIAEIRDAEQTLEPLFFGFFQFENLDTLVRTCVIDSRSGTRSEEKVRESAAAVFRLDNIARDFVCWISDRTSGG